MRQLRRVSSGLDDKESDALAQLKNAGAKVSVDEKTGAVSILFFPKGAITKEQFEQLRSVEKLESLTIGFVQMSDNDLKLLGPFNGLKSLTVAGQEITDVGVQALTRFPELRTLHLAWTKTTDDGLKHIAKMKKLETLSFSPLLDNLFTDSGAAESKRLDLITKVLLGTETISGKGLGHLKDSELKELDLSGTGITDEGLAELSKLTKLERLALFRTDVSDAGVAHLQKVPTLKRVILARGLAKFTDEGVNELQKSLPKCKIDQW